MSVEFCSRPRGCKALDELATLCGVEDFEDVLFSVPGRYPYQPRVSGNASGRAGGAADLWLVSAAMMTRTRSLTDY